MKITTLAKAKVEKWKPFAKGKEYRRWQKEGAQMNKLTKKP